MPRLPQPGQDDGTWGNILNDYLSQSHTSTGALKPGSVGSAQLQDDAVTSTQIQNGTIQEAQLATNVTTKLNRTVSKADVGLSDVDNTSDVNKPISNAVQTALNGKATASHVHAIADVTGLQAALSTAGQPSIVNAGNLGSSSARSVDAGRTVWLIGTLNADHTMNVTLGAGALLRLLLSQDGTGGRAFTLSDGTTSEVIMVPVASGSAVDITVMSDGSTFYYAVSGEPVDPDDIAVGESTISRKIATANSGGVVTMTSGVLRLGYFTAKRTEPVNYLRLWPGNTAAGATPTLLRWGIYEVAVNGNLTLVASTANSPAVFASATSSANTYKLAVSEGTWQKRRGRRYAAAAICVTTATAPTIVAAVVGGASGALTALPPRISGSIASQTDLPGAIAAASVNVGGCIPFMEMLPA